jgi:L-asparaginase
VDLSLYEGGTAALSEGAIAGGDMTSVAAVTKLMHVLGVHRSMSAVRRAMERVVAGERS